MKKVTKITAAAFEAGKEIRMGNTSTHLDKENNTILLRLHGNLIAKRTGRQRTYITNAGWTTNTTKERLNGLTGVSIKQIKKVWYLNGKEWDGKWTPVPRQ